jgi:nitrogen-specific signal transduction histidine kinase
MRSSPRKFVKSAARARKTKPSASPESVMRLRALAHDLSNSLEAILQACYLLGRAKLHADDRRWVQLIDESSQTAARINREIRKSLRELSGDETNASSA